MEIEDILLVLSKGFKIDDVFIGMTISELKRKIGEPSKEYGNDECGYLFYEHIRFSYLGDVIDEISVVFEGNNNLNFKLKEEYWTVLVGDSISSKTTLNQFLQILNHYGIKWRCQYELAHLDYVSVVCESGVAVTFELDEGKILKLVFAPNLNNGRSS